MIEGNLIVEYKDNFGKIAKPFSPPFHERLVLENKRSPALGARLIRISSLMNARKQFTIQIRHDAVKYNEIEAYTV